MKELAIRNGNNTFASPELAKATEDILRLAVMVEQKIQSAKIDIAKIIAELDKTKAYEQDGFKSAVEFGKTVFGWAESTAMMYQQVGRYILSGKPIVDRNGNPFNFTQLRAMAGVKDEKALTAAVESGEFSTDKSEDDFIEIRNSINPERKKAEKREKKLFFNWAHSDELEIEATETEMLEHLSKLGYTLYATFKPDGRQHYAFYSEESTFNYAIIYASTKKILANVEVTVEEETPA